MVKVSQSSRTARTLYNKKDAFGVQLDTENEQSRAELSDTVRAKTSHEKSCDLRRCLKTVSDVDELTLDGRLFHTREAATRNE